MVANSDAAALGKYLKRFIGENIKTLPMRSFRSIEDYNTMHFFLFTGWDIITRHPCYSSFNMKQLESLMEMIDQFDNRIDRPIQLAAIRSIENDPDWKRIQNESRRII